MGHVGSLKRLYSKYKLESAVWEVLSEKTVKRPDKVRYDENASSKRSKNGDHIKKDHNIRE